MSLTQLTGLTSSDALGYIKSLSTKVKQMALNLTDLEVKVEEATNNEPWGPHGSVMAEITEASYDSEGYRQIMGVIARRLQDIGEAWRHVYKSLLLLEYMLKHGPQKVVQELSSNVVVIEKLENFQYKDKNGKDFGENVRHRAKQLAELIIDPDRIREERRKAKELKSKYTGVSSDAMRSRSRTSGSGGLGSSSLSGSGGPGRRQEHGEEEDDDDMYESRQKRTSGGLGSIDKGAIGQSSAYDSHDDAMAATKARINAIKDKDFDDDDTAAASINRKKLSDVKVDPKVAASLGLKVAALPPKPAPRPAAAPPSARAPAPSPAEAPDLMGGLESPPRKVSANAWNAFEQSDGPAAPAASAAPAPAVPEAGGDPWADFSSERTSAPASAAKPVDPVAELFTLQGGAPPPPPPPPNAAAAADPFGFAEFSDSAATSGAPAPPAVEPTGAGSKRALPEDLFSMDPVPMQAPAAPAQQPGMIIEQVLQQRHQQQQQMLAQLPGQQQFGGTLMPGMAPQGGFLGQQPAAAQQHQQQYFQPQAQQQQQQYFMQPQAQPAFAVLQTTAPNGSGLQGSQPGQTGLGGTAPQGRTLSGKPLAQSGAPDPFAGLGF